MDVAVDPIGAEPVDEAVRAQHGEHVQASSAIEPLSPAVLVGQRWYGDGDVRLNTPIKARAQANADRLLVMGLNSVAGPPLDYDDRRPDVFDGAAAVAQPPLTDQLASDVNKPSTINDDVQGSSQLDHTPARAVHLRRVDRPARDRAPRVRPAATAFRATGAPRTARDTSGVAECSRRTAAARETR